MKSILFLLGIFLIVTSGKHVNSTQLLGGKANSEVTVSGVSSGGFMSAQMLVAYSSEIKGAGLFASGPYFCTRGTMVTVADWMTLAASIFTDQLILAAETFETVGLIDKLSNLVNSKVYIFSGSKDKIVWTPVVKKNEEFFRKLGADIQTEYQIGAEHCFPTDFYGNKCSNLGSPYINNCEYKGSKYALEHIMNTSLQPTIDYKAENLMSFDQSKYNPGITSSLADSGYIYVPDAWKQGDCPLHVAFHGCSQTTKDIGLDYVKGTGFLGLAESNGIIILFPQVQKSLFLPINPQGCWDWWGYSELIPLPVEWNFPTQNGVQMKAIYKMIKDLQSGTFETDLEFDFDEVSLSSF
jgi:hypothetical protein